MIITDFIVCDDIRTEASGQHTIVGAYQENIVFPVTPSNRDVWPKQIPIAVFARAKFDQEDIAEELSKIDLSVGLADNMISLGSIDIDPKKVVEKGVIVITAVLKPFSFDGPGEFSIILKVLDKNGNVVIEISPPVSVEIKEIVIEGERS